MLIVINNSKAIYINHYSILYFRLNNNEFNKNFDIENKLYMVGLEELFLVVKFLLHYYFFNYHYYIQYHFYLWI